MLNCINIHKKNRVKFTGLIELSKTKINDINRTYEHFLTVSDYCRVFVG